MAELPAPLITEILSRLPVKPLLRFRCVSKSWQSLIDSPFFINLHLNHSSQNPTHKTLIVKDCFLQDDYPITDDHLYSVDYPTLNRATLINCPFNSTSLTTEIVGSCNGLMCLADGESTLTFLYNPATRKHRHMPWAPVDIAGEMDIVDINRITYGFGYDHVHDDYKLVRVYQPFAKRSDVYVSEVKVYSLKANKWRRVRDFPLEYYLSYCMAWGAYVNGCLHWMVIRKANGCDLIVAFDLATENYKVVPQPEYSDAKSKFIVRVGVLEGCLTVMALYDQVRADLWVMKEYGVKESWTKLFSVPQRESLGFFDAIKPVTYLRKGGSMEVLFELNFRKLVWFDVKRQKAKAAKTRGIPWSIDAVLMVDSLVSLEDHKEKRLNVMRNDSVLNQKDQPLKSSNLSVTFPEKVLSHIFSLLPVKTLLQMQRVCKTWYNLINGPEFIKIHLETLSMTDSGFLIMLKGERVFLVNVQLRDKAIEIKHPLLCNEEYTDIVGSCNGLICLCKDHNIALWNPWTGKHEKMPRPVFHLEHASNVFHCSIHGFGYDTITDDYKIVSILQQYNRLKGGAVCTEVQVFSLKTKTWKWLPHFSYFVCYPCSGVLTNGALHWVARESPDLYSRSNLLIAFDLGVEKCRVVAQPNYVDTNFQMSLGLLRGSLCFLCHYPKESVDLWVMTDYETESWTKLISISQPNVIRCFEYMKPLAYSEDGSRVLFEQDNEKLLWYDLNKKSVKYVKISGLPKVFDSVMCLSSLAPIGSAMRKYKVIREQPSKRVKKSRNKKERHGADNFLAKGFKLKL